jgi:tRNA A-37 threonylcarbamoyl transferase component Bud32
MEVVAVESGTVGGLVAGRYTVEAELATGGMGVVFRVVDRPTGRVLALKRSLADSSDSGPRNAALLEREYRTLVTLRHPCIIRVHDYGVDDVGSFYTMELLDGEDLRARSPIDWRVLCKNVRDVALSLALLHSRRLLHRDVSASNIRLTDEGRAKLIDFGTLMSFGKSDVLAGTPTGVAPEALDGVDLDHRVDLYALGATAYYALTKRHAYPARTLPDLISVWGRGPPPAPSSHVPGIPAELDELVLSLLSLDRSRRPSSAAEVIDRFGAIAGLAPESDDRIAQSYLVSLDLIGRAKEVARFGSLLERAIAGRGSSLLAFGTAGQGRSTLLLRFEKDAKVAGATVLAVNARAYQRPFGTWQALVQRALTEAPDLAARSGAQLEQPAKLAPGPEAEAAFARFFLALAAASPLVLPSMTFTPRTTIRFPCLHRSPRRLRNTVCSWWLRSTRTIRVRSGPP